MASHEPAQTAPQPAPSSAARTTVRHLTEDELNTKIRTLVARLLANAGTDNLADVVEASYEFDLDTAGTAMFSELTSAAYLAGLPSLPCCSDDDLETLEKWVAGVNAIYAAGDVPTGEPMIVSAARRSEPRDHIRIPSTGTTIGGFLTELDRHIADVKARAAAEATEAAYKHAAQHFRDMATEKVDRRTAITILDNLAASARIKAPTSTNAAP